MTTNELRKAEARYQRAFGRSEQAREARNTLIRQAKAEGWITDGQGNRVRATDAAIARATGLTRSRVGQLAQEKT